MLKRAALLIIRVYQAGLSPLLPGACRFTPTCSEYTRIAIQTHGIRRGGWLGVRRIFRCHPFGGFGPDPVPSADPGHEHR
ncbi:MAG: membrane protein insertion efficiency factor YidD [Gemmatimonadota bacterium]